MLSSALDEIGVQTQAFTSAVIRPRRSRDARARHPVLWLIYRVQPGD